MTLAVLVSLPVLLAASSVRWGRDSRRHDVTWHPGAR